MLRVLVRRLENERVQVRVARGGVTIGNVAVRVGLGHHDQKEALDGHTRHETGRYGDAIAYGQLAAVHDAHIQAVVGLE